jgi:hypothetical protein
MITGAYRFSAGGLKKDIPAPPGGKKNRRLE